jgi:hypothetical protein
MEAEVERLKQEFEEKQKKKKEKEKEKEKSKDKDKDKDKKDEKEDEKPEEKVRLKSPNKDHPIDIYLDTEEVRRSYTHANARGRTSSLCSQEVFLPTTNRQEEERRDCKAQS